MKDGDLSAAVVPRLCLVFENGLGNIYEPEMRAFEKDLRKKNWMQAAFRWNIDPLMAQKVWDVTRRLSMNLDVVTFLSHSPAFEEALTYRLQDAEELPVRHVIATTEELFERKIAYMADLSVVYDPEAMRSMRWGSKGRHITNANQLGS